MNLTRQRVIDSLETEETPALLLEPEAFDDAILGIAERAGGLRVVAYDRSRVIDVLMQENMTYEEAVEYYEFNIESVWMGDGTPVFVDGRFAE